MMLTSLHDYDYDYDNYWADSKTDYAQVTTYTYLQIIYNELSSSAQFDNYWADSKTDYAQVTTYTYLQIIYNELSSSAQFEKCYNSAFQWANSSNLL